MPEGHIEVDLIDVTNDNLVGKRGDGTIVFLKPAMPMPVDEALRMAAWIVALADPLDEQFPAVLEAVRGT